MTNGSTKKLVIKVIDENGDPVSGTYLPGAQLPTGGEVTNILNVNGSGGL
jgi:hypothetical protein